MRKRTKYKEKKGKKERKVYKPPEIELPGKQDIMVVYKNINTYLEGVTKPLLRIQGIS